MSVIEKLKQEWMTMRKNKHWLASTLGFVLSEVQKVGKNDGNRETTNDEAIRVIQKIIANLIKTAETVTDEKKLSELKLEKETLENLLPQMATDEEVTKFLKAKYVFAEAADDMPRKGEIMKALRDEFGALVDMKKAGQLVTELYGV